MDIASLGVASVGAITVICYLVGMVVKASPWNNDKYIPIACGVAGAIIGALWFYMGWSDYPAGDPVTAVAVGIMSGLAATGINQVVKQLSNKEG